MGVKSSKGDRRGGQNYIIKIASTVAGFEMKEMDTSQGLVRASQNREKRRK